MVLLSYDPALSRNGRSYVNNRIRVETGYDSICLLGDRIHAVVNSTEHSYELSSVNKIMIITTDLGPLQDDA